MTAQSTPSQHITWYEATLPVETRKNLGHFSTPPRLAQHILHACGYTPDKQLANIRVLDPACGSGNFLLEAARRLLVFGKRTGLSPEEIAALMQRNIWGFDPDPVSCFLAKMQLRTLETEDVGGEGAIHCASTGWHIHQADGLTLPWGDEPCVDLFLANPPYLAAKNADLSAYRAALQRGQTDSYLLFLSLGLHIVRPGGWLGIVLPDPLLARTNAAAERTCLLQEFTISHLWHLANVFTAQVGAVVIIAQKLLPHSTHQVAWIREKWHSEHEVLCADTVLPSGQDCIRAQHLIPQSLFLRQPHAELRYLLSTEQDTTIERLSTYLTGASPQERRFAPLSEFLSIRRGEELGYKSPLLTHTRGDHNEQWNEGMGFPTHFPKKSTSNKRGYETYKDQAMYPVLRGGKDIRPYSIAFDHWWIAGDAIVKPLERYLAPKLLVVKSTHQLQAALDTRGHIALQTLYLLYPRVPESGLDTLYFFLALLNSQSLRRYVYVLHTAYKWVQPQIEQHVLAHLPVPLVAVEQKQQIIANARLLDLACSETGSVVEWNAEISHLYEEQERAICALYDAALLC